MAISNTETAIVSFGVVLLVGALGYELARDGRLGPEIQKLALGIRGQPASGGGGTASGRGRPAVSGGGTARCDASFIPGVRYVALDSQGNYEVVVGGRRQSVWATQQAAEAEYNRLVCGQ